MKNIFPQEIYVAFPLLSSIGVFAYFKYIKNEIIDYKVSLVIGAIFMATGWLSLKMKLLTTKYH